MITLKFKSLNNPWPVYSIMLLGTGNVNICRRYNTSKLVTWENLHVANCAIFTPHFESMNFDFFRSNLRISPTNQTQVRLSDSIYEISDSFIAERNQDFVRRLSTSKLVGHVRVVPSFLTTHFPTLTFFISWDIQSVTSRFGPLIKPRSCWTCELFQTDMKIFSGDRARQSCWLVQSFTRFYETHFPQVGQFSYEMK